MKRRALLGPDNLSSAIVGVGDHSVAFGQNTASVDNSSGGILNAMSGVTKTSGMVVGNVVNDMEMNKVWVCFLAI